jgi:predicted dehydrogenase
MDKFKFAIMGAGGISRQFCDAVNRINGCEVIAVASRTIEHATAFAKENGIKAAYGGYEQMLKEEKPDCVYIGVVASAHYELSMLCLDYKVPVLCEKAMFLNSNQAMEVFKRSAELNVFVMEALWSRFLPAINKAKQWLEEGRIGKPALLDISIGFVAPADKNNRYFNQSLGGGAAFDITVYAYELTTYLVSQRIKEMQVSAIFGETGVDVTDQVCIRFDDMLASLKTSFVGVMEERMVIYGDKGKIVVPNPHFSSEALLYNADKELSVHYRDEETKNGFVYEIQEVMDCVRNGKIESKVVGHQATIDCALLFDRIMECRL